MLSKECKESLQVINGTWAFGLITSYLAVLTVQTETPLTSIWLWVNVFFSTRNRERVTEILLKALQPEVVYGVLTEDWRLVEKVRCLRSRSDYKQVELVTVRQNTHVEDRQLRTKTTFGDIGEIRVRLYADIT